MSSIQTASAFAWELAVLGFYLTLAVWALILPAAVIWAAFGAAAAKGGE